MIFNFWRASFFFVYFSKIRDGFPGFSKRPGVLMFTPKVFPGDSTCRVHAKFKSEGQLWCNFIKHGEKSTIFINKSLVFEMLAHKSTSFAEF